MSPSRHFPEGRRSGFALLITITLLAFLVLLLVSLASLTRVETQVASNNQQLAQARQNALMALNIALGQVQLMLGPDQRVTAPAAQQGDGTVSYSTADLDNNANWVGVYRQDPTTTTRSPQLLNWLVSGNQTLTVPASGANTPTVAPNSIVTGISSTTTVETPITVGGNNAVLLVGPSSVTSSNSNRFVVAPLQNIQVPANTLPGLDPASTTATTIGNYAYWVGDEGIKAKVSLADPWAASTATAAEKTYRLKGAQRSGIEQVESVAGAMLSTNYPANSSDLPKIFDLKQLPLANSAGQAALTDAVKNRFHDLTADTCSVLADVAQGGLKKDLTAWLAYPTTSLAGGAPADTDLIFPQNAGDSTGYGLPKWGIIRSYAGLQGGSGVPLPPQVSTDTQQGFGPVVTYFRLGFSAHCPAPSDPAASSPFIVQAFPVLVLWNPYNTPIAATHYEFVCGFRDNAHTVQFLTYRANGTSQIKRNATLLLTSTPRLITATSDSNSPNGGNSVRKFLRFRVASPQMEPGESLVFTLNSSGNYLPPRDPGAIELSPNNPAATDRSVFFSNPSIVMTAAERADAAFVRPYIAGNPWLQIGLYPEQPAGSDPTVQDMVDQNPYMLLLSLKFGTAGATTNSNIAFFSQPSTDFKGAYVYTKSAMPGNVPSGAYFTSPRWLAQLNPRAPYFYLMPPGSTNYGSVLAMFGDNAQNKAVPNDKFDGNKASASPTIDAPPTSNMQIAELVPASPEPESRFFSLAQLQHANLSLMAQTPGNAVGNSQVNFITGDATTTGVIVPASDQKAPANQLKWFYDTSYLLNQALWDRYFFSTIPHTPPADFGTPGYHLPNSRHTFYAKDGVSPTVDSLATDKEAFNTAAAGLLVNGGFNVNSASEQAWRALLASHNNVDPSAPSGFAHPYARFASTQTGAPANTTDWSSGYRLLSDAQINLLAKNIVTEVKTRGPFLSLADFVNRRLATDATGLKGALQAAIDATDSDANGINKVAPFTTSTNRSTIGSMYPNGGATLAQQRLFLADYDADLTKPSSSRAAFSPGFLTQADLLNSLGPVLTARSDTFRIRTYGDTINPATGITEGKAWCEAVVQRLPDYVDPSMPAETNLNAAPGSAAKTTNLTFGRRLKIISFRWLSPNDI